MPGHRQRVGAIAWGASALSTGSRDRTILQRDVRAPQSYQAKLSGHRSEVLLAAAAAALARLHEPKTNIMSCAVWQQVLTLISKCLSVHHLTHAGVWS